MVRDIFYTKTSAINQSHLHRATRDPWAAIPAPCSFQFDKDLSIDLLSVAANTYLLRQTELRIQNTGHCLLGNYCTRHKSVVVHWLIAPNITQLPLPQRQCFSHGAKSWITIFCKIIPWVFPWLLNSTFLSPFAGRLPSQQRTPKENRLCSAVSASHAQFKQVSL